MTPRERRGAGVRAIARRAASGHFGLAIANGANVTAAAETSPARGAGIDMPYPQTVLHWGRGEPVGVARSSSDAAASSGGETRERIPRAAARARRSHPYANMQFRAHDLSGLAVADAWRWLFNGWPSLARTALVGVLAYAALVVLLRVTGKRTLAKLNAFDLVVTVALGSTLASVLTSRDVALAQGIAAFGVLIALQFVVAWASVRSRTVGRLVRAEPALLAYNGQLVESALRRERVTPGELLAALRSHGAPSLDAVHAVVLETDGSLTVVARPDEDAARAPVLRDVRSPSSRQRADDARGRSPAGVAHAES